MVLLFVPVKVGFGWDKDCFRPLSVVEAALGASKVHSGLRLGDVASLAWELLVPLTALSTCRCGRNLLALDWSFVYRLSVGSDSAGETWRRSTDPAEVFNEFLLLLIQVALPHHNY